MALTELSRKMCCFIPICGASLAQPENKRWVWFWSVHPAELLSPGGSQECCCGTSGNLLTAVKSGWFWHSFIACTGKWAFFFFFFLQTKHNFPRNWCKTSSNLPWWQALSNGNAGRCHGALQCLLDIRKKCLQVINTGWYLQPHFWQKH